MIKSKCPQILESHHLQPPFSERLQPPFFVRPAQYDASDPWALYLMDIHKKLVGVVHVKPAGKGFLVFDSITLALSVYQQPVSFSRIRLLLLIGRILWPFSASLSARLVKWFG